MRNEQNRKLNRLVNTKNNSNMIVQENNTHKAVKNGNKFDIYIKGIELDNLKIDDEFIYSIEHKDDLLPLFELLDEQNRINVNEFIQEIKK